MTRRSQSLSALCILEDILDSYLSFIPFIIPLNHTFAHAKEGEKKKFPSIFLLHIFAYIIQEYTSPMKRKAMGGNETFPPKTDQYTVSVI